MLIKKDRIIEKLYDEDGKFLESVIIPTVYYPLPKEEFKIFSGKECEEVTDEGIIKAFDETEYRAGECFENADRLSSALKEKGYETKTYCGWVVINNDYPTLHCWVTAGKSVLDLSDSFFRIEEEMMKRGSTNNGREAVTEIMQSLLKEKNSERCRPLGIPYYPLIGSKVTGGKEAEKFTRELMKRFPEHKSYIKTRSGYTPLQEEMRKGGT